MLISALISDWNNIDTVRLPGVNAVAAKHAIKESASALTANPFCEPQGRLKIGFEWIN